MLVVFCFWFVVFSGLMLLGFVRFSDLVSCISRIEFSAGVGIRQNFFGIWRFL